MALFADTTGLNQGVLFGARSGMITCRRGGMTSRMTISVTAESGGLKVNTPYSAEFVADLKSTVPATSRKWDAGSKCWMVSRDYSAQLKEIIDRVYGCDVVMPTVIAREMFEQVKDAYQVLSDPLSRNKYNAGLMFEQMAKMGPNTRGRYPSKYSTFTPVLRCGMLTVKAKRELGVLVVEEILSWEDIVNETGQIMVSFWAQDSWGTAWV